MKALKALKEHRARRGSDEEEEETEGTIWKPENGKGQQKVWSLRDSGDDFAMFSFKIVPCSKTCAHDWTVCPYAHCGEIARRRDLKMFSYSAIPCADYQKVPTSRAKGKGSHEYSCPRGANCPYAHGIFESWLHPSRYRTQLCKDGLGCTRKACFFAHKAKELRSVASDNINADSNNNYNSNMSTANKFATMTTTMTTATMQQQHHHHHHQQQQQQQQQQQNRPESPMAVAQLQQQQRSPEQRLQQSRSDSWESVHANSQNPSSSPQLDFRRRSIDSVNMERRQYQQNHEQFVSQQQVSQMTVNQEHAALYLAQRRRELEQQQLLLLQQLQQQQLLQLPALMSVAEAQQISFAKNAAMLQQIQQMQMQHVQIQQQLASAQQPLESPQRNEVDTQKKKSSYDDLGMIIETPDDERQQQQY
ncbi:unnamed protein product [Bathycoccus prasinos]